MKILYLILFLFLFQSCNTWKQPKQKSFGGAFKIENIAIDNNDSLCDASLNSNYIGNSEKIKYENAPQICLHSQCPVLKTHNLDKINIDS